MLKNLLISRVLWIQWVRREITRNVQWLGREGTWCTL